MPKLKQSTSLGCYKSHYSPNPAQFLQSKKPWREVEFSRLYMMLQIEKAVDSSPTMKKDTAWEAWSRIMEYISWKPVPAPTGDKEAHMKIKTIYKHHDISSKILNFKNANDSTELHETKSSSD